MSDLSLLTQFEYKQVVLSMNLYTDPDLQSSDSYSDSDIYGIELVALKLSTVQNSELFRLAKKFQHTFDMRLKSLFLSAAMKTAVVSLHILVNIMLTTFLALSLSQIHKNKY